MLVSTVLSAPLVPFLGIPLFIIGFPRPLRSWYHIGLLQLFYISNIHRKVCWNFCRRSLLYPTHSSSYACHAKWRWWRINFITTNPVDPRILKFISEHHILNLAVSRDNQPYCATCYYAYMPEQNRFIFTSDHDTRHVKDVVEGRNYRAAGTIALETRIVGKITRRSRHTYSKGSGRFAGRSWSR